MRAAVFHGPNDVRIEDIAEPVLGPNDVKIEVSACGICGSDIEYYTGRSPLGTANGKGPLVLGHEFCGRITELGSAVGDRDLVVGDRVAVNPIQSCGRCVACRSGRPSFCSNLNVLGVTTDGGFAEYVRSDSAHVYKIPDGLEDEQGAFVELLAGALNAIEKADIDTGQTVLIYGPGPVGLCLVQLAKARGAFVVLAGTRDDRLAAGVSMGADLVLNSFDPDSPYFSVDLKKSITGRGFPLPDRVLVATSSTSAAEQAFEISAAGATIVMIGVSGPNEFVRLPVLDALLGEKTIKFSLWYPYLWPRTIRLLTEGIVDASQIISHEAALEDFGSTIGDLAARRTSSTKTIIRRRVL